MRKLLTIFGGIFLLLLVVGGVILGILTYLGRNLDNESRIYVDQKLQLILADWNHNEFVKQAAPELLEKAPPKELAALFSKFQERLGKLRSYKGSKGQAKISYAIGQGKLVIGEYLAEADFAKARASISLRIIKRDGKWQILSFFVNSDALLDKKGG